MTAPTNSKNLVAGCVIVVLGLILLAVNLGWLQVDLWTLFWRFWPLTLIAVGLRFVITNHWLYLVIVALMAGGAIWAVSYSPPALRTQLMGQSAASPQDRQELSEGLTATTKQVKITADFGAAVVDVKDLPDPQDIYRATFENAGPIEEKIQVTSDATHITLGEGKRHWSWEHLDDRKASLWLNPSLPLDLNLSAGASKLDLDLSSLLLEQLKLDMGASSGQVTLGAKATRLEATIDSGASSLTLRVPQQVGLKIISDSGLASNNFETAGLNRTEDTYQTPDFSQQDQQITIRLDSGASSTKLERY